MKTDTLKKHHFWLLFGAIPVLVVILLIMLLVGPGDAIAEQNEKYKKSQTEVGGAKASGVGMLTELSKQKDTLEDRRGQLWGINYERQKAAGVFAWPDAGRNANLKNLEKLDLRFGAKKVEGAIDPTKDVDTQFVILNDEMKDFTVSTNYLESYNKMAAVVAPTRFAGNGWQSVLRYVTDWGTGRPESDPFWLALEDFWIQRALLKPIAEVNANAAKFELVKAMPDTPLKRKFQNRTWEIDIELVTEGPNRVLKSKLKNKTDRLQMLGAAKSMRLKVWFEKPDVGNYQPFEYVIGGELVEGFKTLTPKLVPDIHKIPAGSDPVDIYKIEQVLDEVTVPVRLIRRVELGYRDARRSSAELKLPAFFPEDAPAAADGAAPGGPVGPAGPMGPVGPPRGAGVPGGPGGDGIEGPGLGAGTGAGSAGRIGTADQVLIANKKRYLERTEQVRRMPVGLDLVVDQAYVNDVLIALGNSPLRFQVTQTQWQRFRDTLGGSATTGPSGPSIGDPYGPPRGPMGPGGPVGPGGFGSGSTGTAALPTSQVTAGLVELAVYGIVSIYEKAKLKPVDPNKVSELKTEPEPMKPAKGEEPKKQPDEPNKPEMPPTAPQK